MVEGSEKSALLQAPEKSSSEKVTDEVRKLYEESRTTRGGRPSGGGIESRVALGTGLKSLEHLPHGGVSIDGSLLFRSHDGGVQQLGGKTEQRHHLEIGKPPGADKPTQGVKRDAHGRVIEVDYANGQSRKFGYDKKGELNSITQPDGTIVAKDGNEWKIKSSPRPSRGVSDGLGLGGIAAEGIANSAADVIVKEQAKKDATGGNGSKEEHGGEDTHGSRDNKGAINSLLSALNGLGGIGGGKIGGDGRADLIDPKVFPDGTFSYGTHDGSHHTVKPDGSHDFKKADGSAVSQDPDGRTTTIDYSNGQKRTFEYNNGRVSKVTDTDGKMFEFRNGRWVGPDGKPSEKTNFSVDRDGAVTYQDKDGARVTQGTDRKCEVTNANGSHMSRDAYGDITEERLKNGQTRKFEYGGGGQPIKITEPDGGVVTQDAQGNWSDGRKDVHIDDDGTVHYVNKDNHVVTDGTDGNRRISSKTADELRQSAEELHDLIDKSYPLINRLTGPMINRELENLSPTDRALVAQEYEKKYGKKLTDDINNSLSEGDAASANKMIYGAQLQEYAARHMPESQRQAFMDNMNEFMNRAVRDHVSDKEVADTLGQMLRIGNASDAKVTGEQQIWLTQQIMHNAAHPDQIDQGGHKTCNVTDVEMLTYTRNPSKAAAMVADVALTGEFTASDGKKIIIPPQNLVPDAEARTNPPQDGRRSFASQIFQATTLNDAGQRWNPPKYFTNLPPDGGAESGEFWTDEHGNPLLREKTDNSGNAQKDAHGNPIMEKDRFDGLGYHEISDEVKRLTGQDQSVLVSWKDGKLHSFETEDDLRNLITDAQRNGKMPLIIDVTADDKLFGGNKPVGDKDRHAGNHVVVIRDYNPTTGMVRVDNSWGSSSDKWAPLTDLYNASK